ncbi:MAG: hypothetical protein K8J09_04560, partial [Planctomycetes bacterium]|nr:hypothetical protein [Planctomycetota bacterium]
MGRLRVAGDQVFEHGARGALVGPEEQEAGVALRQRRTDLPDQVDDGGAQVAVRVVVGEAFDGEVGAPGLALAEPRARLGEVTAIAQPLRAGVAGQRRQRLARRRELPGRVSYKGEVLKPLDLSGLPAILDDFRKEGVEAIAICFLHSYANTSHEQAALAEVERLWPGVSVVSSHQITREWREYERTN